MKSCLCYSEFSDQLFNDFVWFDRGKELSLSGGSEGQEGGDENRGGAQQGGGEGTGKKRNVLLDALLREKKPDLPRLH